MKLSYLVIALFAIVGGLSTASAETQANETAKSPGWFERLFGEKEEAVVIEAPAEEAKAAKEEISEPQETASKGAKKTKPADKDGFSEADREVIEKWQQSQKSKSTSKNQKKHKTLPPGLQKKVDRGGELPPGWKKKLEVGTVLDPEVDKASTPLPEEILKRLPEIPQDTEILQVGDEIIRVIESTREIIGIFDGWSGNAED